MTALSGEVLVRLRSWLPPNEGVDRPQVQLATVDADGRPDLRTVLLSEWDSDGFVFHTDAASRKAAHIAGRSAVALLVLRPGSTRQLVVQGDARLADADRSSRAFDRRSPYLKQLAWQNSTAFAQLDRPQRVAAWRAFATATPPAELSAPDGWAGYVVDPTRLTFWESDPDGPSHRVEFRTEADGWTEHHLAG